MKLLEDIKRSHVLLKYQTENGQGYFCPNFVITIKRFLMGTINETPQNDK